MGEKQTSCLSSSKMSGLQLDKGQMDESVQKVDILKINVQCLINYPD